MLLRFSNQTTRRALIGVVDFVMITATIVTLLARALRLYLLFLEGRSARRELKDWTNDLYRSQKIRAASDGPHPRTYVRRPQDYSFP